MALTDVQVASKALVLIGANPISDFDEGTTESKIADNIYETIVEAALTRIRWRFASGQQQLSRLVSTPVSRYDAAYQVPNSPPLLVLHAVTVLDTPIKFDRYENHIYCDASEDDIVVADYTYRPDTEYWPPYFTRALIYDLAGIFAAAVAQRGDLAEHYEKRAEMHSSRAQNIESQQRTTKRVNQRKNLIERRF